MRTFHIGGTASRRVEQADIRARVDGKIRFDENLNVVVNAEGKAIIMNRRGGNFSIVDDKGRERERHPVIYGAHLLIKDGQDVQSGEILAVWDPFTTPIITEVAGRVKFGDIALGKTMQEKVDSVTGKSSRTIIESKSSDVRPRISIKDSGGENSEVAEGVGCGSLCAAHRCDHAGGGAG